MFETLWTGGFLLSGIGLILTLCGALVTAAGVIVDRTSIQKWADKHWGANKRLASSLVMQSGKAKTGLIIIAVGTALQIGAVGQQALASVSQGYGSVAGGEFWTWVEVHPGLAAWAQAIAATVALAIAIWVPWRQTRDNERQRIASERTDLRLARSRIAAAIEAEVETADELLEVRTITFERLLAAVAKAKAEGKSIDVGEVRPGDFKITDSIVFQAAASEIGVLPASLVRDIVKFHMRAKEIEHVAAFGNSLVDAIENVRKPIRGLRLTGEILRLKLRKFSEGDFADNTPLDLSKDEMIQAARSKGYPLEDVAKQYGVML